MDTFKLQGVGQLFLKHLGNTQRHQNRESGSLQAMLRELRNAEEDLQDTDSPSNS